MAEVVALRLTLGIAWRLFAPKTASHFEHGDIAEEKLRQLLLNEFQKIHEHLNALRRKELVAAIAFLETGYDLISHDTATAGEEFRKARDAALMAFGVVAEVADKIMATKILVTATIHEFTDNIETSKTLVTKYVSRLNSLPEVVKICQVLFESTSNFKEKLLSLTSKSTRRDILGSVADVNYSAWEFVDSISTDFHLHWPRISLGESNIHPVHDLCLFRSCELLCTFEGNFGSVVAAEVTKKYIFMAIASCNDAEKQNMVTVFEIETGIVRHLVGHSGNVLALASNDHYLFSASFDKSLMVWNASSLHCVKILKEHEGAIRTLCMSEKYLFSGSTDSSICIWSSIELVLCRRILANNPVTFLTCSRKKFLYCLTALHMVQIWDVTRVMNQDMKEPTCTIEVGSTANKLISSDNLLFACGKDSVETIKLGSLRNDGNIDAPGFGAVLFMSNKFLLLQSQDLEMWNTKTRKKVLCEKLEGDCIIDHIWIHKSNLYVSYYDIDINRHVIKKW